MFKTSILTLAALAACAIAAPAWAAGTSRVWVSGHGADQAGCGAPTAPCRSLQYAHDHAVVAGGEIDILDPAGYGAITITKSISIVNDGVGTAGVQATSGNGVVINAPGGSVYLRGLNIDGDQGAALNGVQVVSNSDVTLINCVIRHFSDYGIQVVPTTGSTKLLAYDTISSSNAYGFVYSPGSGNGSITGILDHFLASDNTVGVYFGGLGETGIAKFSVVNSDLSNNNGSGITVEANAGNVAVDVDLTDVNLNGGDGLFADGGAIVHLSRSVLDQNGGHGVLNDGQIFSTGDNRVEGNALGAVNGGSLTSEPVM